MLQELGQTQNGGLLLVAELDRVLSVTVALDAGIGPVKERDRGLSGGEFTLATALVQLTGEDHLVGSDRLRADRVGEGLLPAPVPAPTTAATLAGRFGQAQHEGPARRTAAALSRSVSRSTGEPHSTAGTRLSTGAAWSVSWSNWLRSFRWRNPANWFFTVGS